MDLHRIVALPTFFRGGEGMEIPLESRSQCENTPNQVISLCVWRVLVIMVWRSDLPLSEQVLLWIVILSCCFRGIGLEEGIDMS
jgi:hypothetical protein